MNTSAKFNALFRDVSVGALSALTIQLQLRKKDEKGRFAPTKGQSAHWVGAKRL